MPANYYQDGRMIEKKYAVYYSGGSGGFMFYWSLQLALGNDVQDSINKNWDISDLTKWKQSEQLDLQDPDAELHGNVLRCNANCNQGIFPKDKDKTTLLIYTDIDSQLTLAEAKSSHWFTPYGQAVLGAKPGEMLNKKIVPVVPYFTKDNIKINDFILETFKDADHKFLLQDVIATRFKCVTDALGLEHTQEVADHVDRWVALHPKHIQEMLTKDLRND